MSRVLQKLLKSFNGTVITTFFVLLAQGVLPVILALDLNHPESLIVAFGLSLKYSHKLPDFVK